MLPILFKMTFRASHIVLFLLVGILVSFSSFPAGASDITDIRFWSAPDHTRIVLDLTEPIRYETLPQENPLLLNLDLKGSLRTPKKEVSVNDSSVSRITLTEQGKGTTRIAFYQKKPLNANIFLLKPFEDKPHRLVIDLVDVALEKKEQEERQRQKEVKPKGMKTVVIDPGHGGEDPGAVGPKKTMEKNVVLKIGE